MRRIFHSPELEEIFWRDGAVVAELLDASEVEELASFYSNEVPSLDLGFHATVFSRDPGYRARVNERVRSVLWPKLASYFLDYAPVLGTYVVKEHSRAQTEVAVHQDWTFVDETVARSLNVWCPLVDTDRHNGGQFIFKGSHRMTPTIRGPFFPSPLVEHARLIAEDYLIEVPLRAGQAIIYDHSLIHATPANLSGKTRVATNLVLVPREAQMVHCYFDQSTTQPRYEVFAVGEEFFLRNEVTRRPVDVPVLGVIDHIESVLTVEQLSQARANAVA